MTTAASPHIRAPQAIDQFRSGRPLIVLDDRREMEGDLAVPAELATPEVIKFMASRCSGLLCLAMPRRDLERIGIPPMVSSGPNPTEAPFYYPVDAAWLGRRGRGGISAWDRHATVQALLDPGCCAGDLVWPGHLVMLGARDGGLRERVGHTEACTDLAALAGHRPCALLCEILDDEGEMARGEVLEAFARACDLSIVRLTDILALNTA